ncbi:fluoride efflux transporter CrcB [Desulfonema magnum]|uniref:Fluoride-specific ion channel FluC n=1 Tax=Desulfonema magnum TaxID=45655 RepID=A0A975BMU2_9BACT|nr:fluoride efflux transporter CrcB [Desulfonema magnum]QTA88172.1 Putative fluoride ion transporter [Desulfonema magnum]
MNKIILVGTGGFVGAILRYVIGGYVQKWTASVGFPYGTLSVNLIGCLVIGMLSRMDEIRSVFSPEIRLLVFVGVLGALTTFSTFSNETISLMNDKRIYLAFLNIVIHIIFGLSAVLLGRIFIYLIWR